MANIYRTIIILLFLLQDYSVAQIKYSTPLIVKFDEISISIENVGPGDYESIEPFKETEDSLHFDIGLGYIIEGKIIKVISSKLSDVRISQSYETSVSIQNEGPHIDLNDWKHFKSEWKELVKDEEGNSKIIEYTAQDWVKFPEIDIEELKEAVYKIGGPEWRNLIEHIKSPTEYPSSVGINKIELKINGMMDNKKIKKIIVLNLPMGC